MSLRTYLIEKLLKILNKDDAESETELTREEKEQTANHEAGHALVALALENYGGPKLSEVEIVSIGDNLGFTLLNEKRTWSRQQTECTISTFMAGRVSDELTYEPELITAGAASDFKEATYLATLMVCRWGMSKKLGLRRYVEEEHPYSEATAQKIDNEIDDIIYTQTERARKILTNPETQKNLKKLTKSLLIHNKLSRDEVLKILKS